MGVSLDIDDYERLFQNLHEDPAVLNDLYSNMPDSINPVKAVMVTEYEGDFIQTIPSCSCQETTGRPNKGIICPNCSTKVMTQVERGFMTDVWVETPENVKAFILPNFFLMLDKCFVKDKFNAFRYLCDNRYKVVDKARGARQRFDELGIERGYNHFIENFEEIFMTVMEHPLFRDRKKYNVDVLAVYRKYTRRLFPRFLPMPSKRSVITELSGKSRKVATGYQHLLNGASIIFEACSPSLSTRSKERATFNALSLFAQYHSFVDKEILGSKEGWYRKHVFGSRMGMTFRAVISSLAGVHKYDEVELPFALAVATFRPLIMNKLLAKGYTVNEGERFICNAVADKSDQTDSEMMRILNELIEECPFKGLPILFGRQPTLNLRSIQLLYATRIKTNPLDNTIGLSLLVLKAPNADFDGDQMQGMYIMSYIDWTKAKMLAPHSGINNLNGPHSLNRNLILPDTDFSVLNNFAYGKDQWK